MYVILGGTGHVGSAVADALLRAGEPVTLVTRHAEKGAPWSARGARVAVADIADTDALRAALARGRRALIVNPPADPATDTDQTERQTVSQILRALESVELDKIVAVSTGGARPGHRLGDLNTLWELETGLQRLGLPTAINRGAYYMSNWDASLPAVRETGVLTSFFPADLAMPMVAPRDLGEAAARRLRSDPSDVGVVHVEGPARYTPRDVAETLGQLLGRTVSLQVVPRGQWISSFRELGFSAAAAESYARMVGLMVDEGFPMPADSARGTTRLHDYLAERVASTGTAPASSE
jgi:uncharacterized protein YbjT (DUF2867 family)